MMKKIINSLLVLSILLVTFLPVRITKAQTLADYKKVVAKLESQKNENQRMSQEASNKIAAKEQAVKDANNTIAANEQKVEDSKVLVADSEETIKIKTEDLKDVINFLQYTDLSSQDIYLDYVFDASSIADLMERNAVVEQIANYTQEEINSLETLIDDNKKLQVKLNDDNIALEASKVTYSKQIEDLEETIHELAQIGLDVSEELQAKKNLVKIYESAGCKDNDDIQACYYDKQLGSASFSRPLNFGTVSQRWSAAHGGADLAVAKGNYVYAPADGTVVFVRDGIQYYNNHRYLSDPRSCGGHEIYMHHKVNGKSYTTEYAHLTSILVKNGQYVTKGTIIATTGGDSSTHWYDKCTTGAHLHYAISSGYYFTSSGYGSEYYTFKANTKTTANYSISGIKDQYGWKWSSR